MSATIDFIGAGNTTRAMLSGVEKGGDYTAKETGIFDISEKVREDFAFSGYVTYESIESLVKGSSVVVVAVTP